MAGAAGYLAYKSGWFPQALGVLLVVGGVCDLVDILALFLLPDFGEKINAFVLIPPAIAEFWMVGYLLAIGVKTVKPAERILAGGPPLSPIKENPGESKQLTLTGVVIHVFT